MPLPNWSYRLLRTIRREGLTDKQGRCRYGRWKRMCPAILNHIICVILARCWSGLRKNWAMMSGFSALWPWRWEIPVRSSLTICLWAISGEHSSRNCGGLPEKMCTCRALCIFWKQMRHSAMPCWRNWQKGSVRERKKPCLYCRYLMIGNAAMR